VVLADLGGGVAVRLEQFRDRRVFVLQSLLRARHADFQEAYPERMLAGHEGRPSGGCSSAAP